MIIIKNNPLDINTLSGEYPESSIERLILNTLSSSDVEYRYKSLDELKFELLLRKEIVNASKELYKSNMDFAVFRKARANDKYWKVTNEGGFLLKENAIPSEAINDIFINTSEYATECATAMIIIYYKALLNVFQKDKFNVLFPKIHLMNWHYIDRKLKEIGLMRRYKDYLPGDRRYFENPDVDPLTPEWQGENVIDLSNGRYYGHGIGLHTADIFIRELNKNRIEGSEKSAYLLDSAGRPDFKKLADMYYT